MTESAEARRYKRVVEFLISGFERADEAVKFAQLAQRVIKKNIKDLKFDAFVGAPFGIVAITADWDGPTVLKFVVAEIMSQNDSIFIVQTVRDLSEADKLRIEKETIKEKPQDQFINLDPVPKSSQIYNIGKR